MFCINASATERLFKATCECDFGGFIQALEGGADINMFDEEGMTPLMSIARACDVTYGRQPMLEKMAKLLIQNSSININAQSRKYVYEERQKRDRHGHLVYLFCGQEVAEVQRGYYIYCNNGRPVNDMDSQGERECFSSNYDGVKEEIRTSKIQKNTALHIACQVGAKDIVKILLTHPGIKTDVRNCEDKDPKDCIARGFEDVIKLEFKKAQKANELLGVLASRGFYQANMLLNEELNPNCWKRNLNGEIETPFSLIIKSCLLGITPDKEEVLTKLLKHKDLDFSQIKPIQGIEQNPWTKGIIEKAIKERLTDAIDRKDLDDVKKLVEDNCFMNRAIVTAALMNVSHPIESIKNYLNEKFPASVEQPSASAHNVASEINDELIAQELQQLENLRDELERTKAQLRELSEQGDEIREQQNRISELERELSQTKARLREKEQKLVRIMDERASETDKISQLEKDLRQIKQEKLDQQTKIREVIGMLVSHIVEIKAQNGKGRAPLHVAAKLGNQDVAKVFIDSHSDVNAKDEKGRAPLHVAAKFGNQDVAKVLIDNGADINAKAEGQENWAPLHIATREFQLGMVELLVSKGANVDARDKKDRTPLHVAAEFGNQGAAEVLLSSHAGIEAQDEKGRTPLHIAVRRNQLSMVEFLVNSRGAKIDAKDKKGMIPLDIATKHGYGEIMEFFQKEELRQRPSSRLSDGLNIGLGVEVGRV